MAEVEFRSVTKEFSGSVRAVDDLNLQIADQEFMVLVGPSGCGKTTALRMIAGLETPTHGEIVIGGEVVNDRSPGSRDIAMVFQNYALYPHMNVERNIGFGLRQQRMPRAEIAARVQEVSALLGLEELLHRRPGELSGGQRQRVAMGRALARHPRVFLLDEPLSNLDAKLRTQLRAELKRIHHKVPTTSVYVTHDQIEAMTLADRVAVMSAGKIQQLGTPQEVYDHPANLFVAGFIGNPPMNLLPAAATGTSHPGAVTVGVRPERLMATGGEGPTLQLLVDVVEPLGAEVMVHGTVDGIEITARLDGDARPGVGERLPLTIDPAHVYLFDADGLAIRT